MPSDQPDRLIDPIGFLVEKRFVGYPYDCSAEMERYRAELTAEGRNIRYRLGSDYERAQQGAKLSLPSCCQPLTSHEYDHWSKLAYWRVDEAAALALDKNPKRLKRPRPGNGKLDGSLFVVQEFLRLCEVIERAQIARQLKRPIKPKEFFVWASNMRISCPSNLKERVLLTSSSAVDWEKRYVDLRVQCEQSLAERDDKIDELRQIVERTAVVDKPLHTKERNSMLSMIGGMAAAFYGYDPNAKRSGTVKEITTDLHRVGVHISDDTVRKYLEESREALSLLNNPPPR
jgi:hypothetical protein